MKIIKNLVGDWLAGLVFWLPVLIIIFISRFIFGTIEELGRELLTHFLNKETIYPGLGALLGIIIFYLTGVILKRTPIGNFLSVIPIVGLFFRKNGGATITFERLLHLPPCLFLLSPTCPSYGWILSEEKIKLNGEKTESAESGLISVYYPNVPSLVTGQVFPVPKETVMKLGNQSREIIDLLLYAIRSPECIVFLPWQEENEEKFRERAKLFGLKLSTD